ncbi:hypothetical protein GCM10007916_00780 [Psychromonas marina]|uniref:DUF1778 domain-containing protein n=1 Tax=Psychromonas marina TaxID=88364 RepID=A0ABQ6DWA0_9GAMM|nr:DUF1778 domain-containing protein [Psychromonas marina]GLS89011.1 hypothetical protein GCM10007916_00780 [Psychromonas marina]
MAATLPRITARVDLDTQELLAQAAAITGMSSINSFVVSAALEKAKTIMERERSLQLSQQDAMTLMDALDKPAKVNDKLQQAASRYMNKTQ